MSKKKYNYIHKVNGKEVTRGEFTRRLATHCTEVWGNSDNPLLNVEMVDDKKLTRLYNRLMKKGHLHIFINGDVERCEDFRIIKEKIL